MGGIISEPLELLCVGDRALPSASTLLHLCLPQHSHQRGSGLSQPPCPGAMEQNRQHWDRTGRDGTGSARVLEHEMVTVLLHSNPQAKS